ncbi:hypothetical protein INT43_008034, partial [Umbelopsis isabellina]
KPICKPLCRLLLPLFQLCWTWSYTPPGWRHAQVCPIFKKGDPTLASNYRPISLTSILRKAMEYCLAPALSAESPELDLAQGGFRPQRSAMDQALCLHELMHMQRQRQHRPTVVAFLDIKSAYDTVDRNIIWQTLASHGTNTGLLSLIKHLFDDVTTSVLLSNQTSAPSSPATGVLQGSVLSPYLYSIYINSLPEALRAVVSPNSIRVADPPTVINSLLFADDVAILGSVADVQRMLDIAAAHSHLLGYRWSPTKCATLNSPRPLTLYGEELQSVEEFVYLGLPFRKNGLSASSLIEHRTKGTRLAMATLQAIGARPSGFHPLLSARLYRQFIRPKFEYGLAISALTKTDVKNLNRLQDRCLRAITGGHPTSTVHPFRHMTDTPTMGARALTLTLKFGVRLTYLPDDCLISLLSPVLLPCCRLPLLRLNPLYTALPDPPPLDLKDTILEYRQGELELFRESHILVRGCRPTIGIDPVLLVPATRRERSRLLRWRLGWLPGKPRACLCGTDRSSRRHLMECPMLPQHLWLQLPYPSDGSNHLDFAISQIPASLHTPPAYWPALHTLLFLIDQMCLQEGTLPPEPNPGSSWVTHHHNFHLYNEILPNVEYFTYLGVPFGPKGMEPQRPIELKAPKTVAAMQVLKSLGVHGAGLGEMLSAKLYRQFIRPKMEYGLAISKFLVTQAKSIDGAQDKCLRMIFRRRNTTSTSVFRHLTDLPDMQTRILTLRAKFAIRAETLPPDTLFCLLIPKMHSKHSRWRYIQKVNPIFDRWDTDRTIKLKDIIEQWRQDQHDRLCLVRARNAVCRPLIGPDPILALPAIRKERSRLLRWRLGWLPAQPLACPCGTHLTKKLCFQQCPAIPDNLWPELPAPDTQQTMSTIDFTLNQLPVAALKPGYRPSAQLRKWWPVLLELLRYIDMFCHADSPFIDEPPAGALLLATPTPDEE